MRKRWPAGSSQSRAVALQARVLVAPAARTADVIVGIGRSDGDREAAADELRTYMVRLLREAAAPLITALSSEERAAISSAES